MGFFTRRLIPRKVRRIAHPIRAVKRAVTPKPVKKVLRGVSIVRNPLGNAAYAVERSVFTKKRKKRSSPAPVYRHGKCPIKHRSSEVAMRCKN